MPEPVSIEDRAVRGLKNDPAIWISEGANRFDMKWKNKQIHWSVLLAKLKDVTRTRETQAEYLALSKKEQDGIKDVGGFVGGTLEGGRRKSETVKTRSLITFDLDFAPVDFIEQMTLDAPHAWAIYSTHKHTPDKPRLRYIVPLSRDVTPDEYEAIARKLAEDIGMSYFDATTFQPSRLMYWPSASADGAYIFEYNDGESLNADEVLSRYPDWKDVSYWPTSPDEARVKKSKVQRQQDPLNKHGSVGVFCRTYTVPEAIAKFLPDVYTPTDGAGDRYTYVQGSTSGGLVIYDNGLFAYSNHGTDPAHGLDLNAFDLVRVHLFGHEDADTPDDIQAQRRPSYKAMLDMISKDSGCIATYDAEKRASALEDFDGEDAEEGKATDWRNTLERSKSLEVEKTINNLVIIFANDENLRGIRFDELAGVIRITGRVPWKKELTEWKNTDDGSLLIYLAGAYTTFKRQDIIDVMTQTALDRKYNPIKEYLEGLPDWDGIPRIDTLFQDYLGAEDNAYTREVSHKWLLAAISRVYAPGCKFDYVPVLSGAAGIGKSTLASKLGGEWFSDSLGLDDMRDKTAAEKIQGVWIMEIGELKGIRKIDVEVVKSFISRQYDKYRPSYGRVVENHPRTCVCIGTSNADDYLRDSTGNRRFWPVPVTGASKLKAWDMTADDVAQIWAEAFYYYHDMDDKTLMLSKEVDQTAKSMQMAALEHDEREGIVELYLDYKVPENWDSLDTMARNFYMDENSTGDEDGTVRDEVSIMEIWAECFRKAPTEKKRSDSDDIARILISLGWQKSGSKRQKLYGKQNIYKRPTV